MPIINWLTDTDFYTFPMAQLANHQLKNVQVEYAFKCRNGLGTPGTHNQFLLRQFMDELHDELNHLCTLRFKPVELEYLREIPFLSVDFIEDLRLFQMNRSYINMWADKDGQLQGRVKGPLYHTIWFEQPVLSIVSELNSKYEDGELAKNHMIAGERKLTENLELVKRFIGETDQSQYLCPFQYGDFGTRRRRSFEWQDYTVGRHKKEVPPENFVGTSNVHLAMKHGVRYLGTMAHQLFQAFQQSGPRLIDHQKACLDAWAREFRGSLGIALSDIVGMERFLKDFDLYFAKLFDGCRHDSGDPRWWCNLLIDHYNKLRIDPRTKTAIFSDGLTFRKAIELYLEFAKKIRVSAGIGTNFTNDMSYQDAFCSVPYTAIQIVIKLVRCNGKPTAKVSDSKGKGMCEDPEFESYLRKVFDI